MFLSIKGVVDFSGDSTLHFNLICHLKLAKKKIACWKIRHWGHIEQQPLEWEWRQITWWIESINLRLYWLKATVFHRSTHYIWIWIECSSGLKSKLLKHPTHDPFWPRLLNASCDITLNTFPFHMRKFPFAIVCLIVFVRCLVWNDAR